MPRPRTVQKHVPVCLRSTPRALASVLPTFLYCTAIPKRVAGVVVRLLWKRASPPVVCTAGWPCAVTSHTKLDATTQSPPLYCTMCLCCSPVCAAQSLVLSVGRISVRPLQARLELSSFADRVGNPQDTLLPFGHAVPCAARRARRVVWRRCRRSFHSDGAAAFVRACTAAPCTAARHPV